MPFGEGLQVASEDINSISFLEQQALEQHARAAAEERALEGRARRPASLKGPPGLEAMKEDVEALAKDVDLMAVQVGRATWEELGLDLAPFTVQAQAPMSLVHFYFSQLTLNCVFVVDTGRFVGMINKSDMMKGDF